MIWDVYAAGSGPPLLVASDGGHLTIDPRLSALNPNADASKSSLASKPSTEEDAHSYSVTGAHCSERASSHGYDSRSIAGMDNQART